MNYYNNPELARQFGVDRRTVTNWIKQTRQGRLDLELVRDGSYDYIAKAPKNLLIMQGIVRQRRKFINKRNLKIATPQSRFYELFSDDQIIDLFYSLEKYREVPRQYNYLDEGASLWDEHTWRQYGDTVPNMVTQTIALLDANVS